VNAIAKAETAKEKRICLACGGADHACGGSDDLGPGDIGFAAACPDATVPGGAACAHPVTALGDVVSCVDCMSDFETACLDAAAVPAVKPYPPACHALPTPTVTPTPTATPTPPAGADAPQAFAGALPASTGDADGAVDATAMASVIEVLRDAGVLTVQPRALLQAPDGHASRVALMDAYVESHPESARELAYLANAIISGCTIQDRPFTPQEASDAAVAVCNLGLENWPPRWADRDLTTVFQVGWTALHKMCTAVARELIDVVAQLTCRDRDIQLRLHALSRELARHLRDGAPWRARHALEVIVMLDAPSWAALLALIDECPVMHAAVERRHSRRAIDVGDFAFISHNGQIDSVHAFMEALPSTLTR